MTGYEHALFILLLLCYLLRDMSDRHPVYLLPVTTGILLATLPPIFRFEIPWALLFALALPLVFRQNAHSWLHIERRFPWREAFLWLVTALSLTHIVAFLGALSWLNAVFLGIVAASMLLQATNHESSSNPFGNIGLLTLVFLLLEISLALEDPGHPFASLISGAGAGIIIALLSISVARKLPPQYKSRIALAQVYLSYWFALAIGSSAIAASLINVIVFAEFYERRLGKDRGVSVSVQPETGPAYLILLVLFILTAWQTHQPLTWAKGLEAALGLCVGLVVALLGKRLGLLRFTYKHTIINTGVKISLLLLAILVLWPGEIGLSSTMIWISLGLAITLPVLSVIILTALRDLGTWLRNPYSDRDREL